MPKTAVFIGRGARGSRRGSRRTRLAAVCLAAAAAATAAAGSAVAQEDSPPPIRAFDLATIEKLGATMHRHDLAAAEATDIVLSQALDLERHPVQGWVVTGDGDDLLVTFVGMRDGEYRGFFDVRPSASRRRRFQEAGGRRLTETELARFKARQAARGLIEEPCSERYNSIVIEDPSGPGWLVYWLAATAQAGVIPVGGHYRFTVSADGTTVERADRLSLSCLAIDRRSVPAGAETAAVFVTHLVSDTLVETHVFLSLLHDVPFAVGTAPDTIWFVDGGKILRAPPPP